MSKTCPHEIRLELAKIDDPAEVEGWIAEARRAGNHESANAGLARLDKLRRGRKA